MTPQDERRAVVEQPPTRIYILDYGTDDSCWCNDPDPSGYGHHAVEYIRKDAAISTILEELPNLVDGRVSVAGANQRENGDGELHKRKFTAMCGAMLSKYKEENGL